MTIITNNIPRSLLYWHDLTDKEQNEFDFTDKEIHLYFRYKKNIYCLGDFVEPPVNSDISKWDRYMSDSFFSGILIKLPEYGETVIVGTYYS